MVTSPVRQRLPANLSVSLLHDSILSRPWRARAELSSSLSPGCACLCPAPAAPPCDSAQGHAAPVTVRTRTGANTGRVTTKRGQYEYIMNFGRTSVVHVWRRHAEIEKMSSTSNTKKKLSSSINPSTHVRATTCSFIDFNYRFLLFDLLLQFFTVVRH